MKKPKKIPYQMKHPEGFAKINRAIDWLINSLTVPLPDKLEQLMILQDVRDVLIGKQMHWPMLAVLSSGLKRGWANPVFSEVVMGFPPRWTDLDVSGTP